MSIERSVTTRKGLEPFRQGDLDGLCGLYSIINAIRWCYWPMTFSRDTCIELLATLLVTADTSIGSVAATAYGVDPKPLWRLCKAARRHIFDIDRGRISIARPFASKTKVSRRHLLDWLAQIDDRPARAAIVELTGHYSHWSVATSTSSQFLNLFDSSDCRRVRLDHCQIKPSKVSDGKVEHILRPSAIVLFEADIG